METKTMIKEIPILYSTAMIQAKLAGRKTNTRRTSKLNEINENPKGWKFEGMNDRGEAIFFDIHGVISGHDPQDCYRFIKCPYGKPGDLLYARETWRVVGWDFEDHGRTTVQYKDRSRRAELLLFDDDRDKETDLPWKPSIHMPKAAARIWDRVLSIRVERLQDISEEDAIAEGIEKTGESYGMDWFANYSEEDIGTMLNPKESYRTLWESINGPGSWELNPWVWVVTTENVSLTGKPQTPKP